METEKLLNERQSTHGSFEANAVLSQKLKTALYTRNEWMGLCAVHKEALDMICLKISRIMSGQATFADHWQDISGYATLASKACNGPSSR